MNQHVGERDPLFLVMVDEQRDLRIFGDIAHPLEAACGQPLGLLIDDEVKMRFLVEPET